MSLTRLFTGVLLALCCGGLVAGCGSCSVPGGETKSAPTRSAPEPSCSVIGAIPYWAQSSATESFRNHVDQIDSIYVFWYNLDADGNVRKYRRAREDRALIEFAHQHGVSVFALIANLPDDERDDDGGDWDPQRVGRVISSEERRAAHIADLLALTERVGFDGILIDYESLPGEYRENFTRFIAELGNALHAKNKLLAVALHPKTSENNPAENNGSAAQDWEALQAHADQLHFMTYGEHTSGSAPGPVASPSWVERVLGYAAFERKLPAAKIYMGLPLYAEEWREQAAGGYRGLNVDLSFHDAQKRKHKHGGKQVWSGKHESPYIVYRDRNDARHILWFENRRSSEKKLRLAAELGLCNIFLWRLGGEDPGIWEILKDKSYLEQFGRRSDGRDWKPEAAATTEEEEDDEEEEEEEDSDTETSLSEDGRMVWRLWGRRGGYPRLEGEASAELEYYSKFATADPTNEQDNWLTHINLDKALAITSKLAVKSDMRLVLKSDGGHEQFSSDYPSQGLYVNSLWLTYQADSFAVFGGKYEPDAGNFGYAPIFFGNYSTNLKLDRRVGLGASATLKRNAIGSHTLAGHAFCLDTSPLSGEVFTGQARRQRADGGLANTGRPDSFLVTLDGGTVDTSVTFHYTLGGGVQRSGKGGSLGDGSTLDEGSTPDEGSPLDERIYLATLNGAIPLRQHGELELSVDFLSLGNAGGQAEDTQSIGLGVAYGRNPFHIGAAWSTRFVNPQDQTGDRTDLIAEIVARYELGRALLMEAAYQHIREGGGGDNSFGIVFRYMASWLVH